MSTDATSKQIAATTALLAIAVSRSSDVAALK
jgi:hypothetical protein